jgi:hypothetical protein
MPEVADAKGGADVAGSKIDSLSERHLQDSPATRIGPITGESSYAGNKAGRCLRDVSILTGPHA